MNNHRRSGILLHPTALPSCFGIGDFGPTAYTFADKLADAGQTLWQILPLVPTDAGGSPYSGSSAFAGNPLLISPELLLAENLLCESDLVDAYLPPAARVDYKQAAALKLPLLERAFQAFLEQKAPVDYTAFCERESFWLEDHALYTALKAHFFAARAKEEDTEGFDTFSADCAETALSAEQLRSYYDSAAWVSFPRGLKKRNIRTLAKWRRLLAREIEKERFLQYIFQKQWQALKAYANGRGISVIGDIPLFLSHDSADVWANQRLFRLDGNGFPTCVTGVPPDYFSKTGQLWGNPHYAWRQHEKTGFAWWLSRIQRNLQDIDILRIDHFRGFSACWEIPFGAEDARDGKWVSAPGEAFFALLKERLGTPLPLIAEDLGILTDDVLALRGFADLPGMRILQFAFGGEKNNAYLPHCYEKNTVVYTGTHDNNTANGWYATATEAEKDHYRRYMNVDGSSPAWDLIRLAFSSPADFAIVPLQDVLSLGAEHRMNIPGTAAGNWGFRFSFDWWQESASEGLRYLSSLFGRNEKTDTSP